MRDSLLEKVRFGMCPRCGSNHYEHLSTYTHCVECNYSSEDAPDRYDEIPVWLQKRKQQEKLMDYFGSLAPMAAS